MICELRIYEALPDRLPQLGERFSEVTLGVFKAHGS